MKTLLILVGITALITSGCMTAPKGKYWAGAAYGGWVDRETYDRTQQQQRDIYQAMSEGERKTASEGRSGYCYVDGFGTEHCSESHTLCKSLNPAGCYKR